MIWSELWIETCSDRSMITINDSSSGTVYIVPTAATLNTPAPASSVEMEEADSVMLTTLRNLSCHLDPGISSLAQLDPEQVTYTIYSIYTASCCVTTGTDSHLCNALQTSASGLDISTINVNNNALKFTNQAATSARNHHNVKTYYFPKIHY